MSTMIGCLEAAMEPLPRTIPSPFQLLKKRDDTDAERSVQQHMQSMRKRHRSTAATCTIALSEHEATHGVLFGKILVRPRDFGSDDRNALSGWTSPTIERVVPFARVLRVLDRCAKYISPVSACLTPRGLSNVSNDCFANSVLQVLFHCDPLRLWFEQTKVPI
jgi:hypothetical protein